MTVQADEQFLRAASTRRQGPGNEQRQRTVPGAVIFTFLPSVQQPASLVAAAWQPCMPSPCPFSLFLPFLPFYLFIFTFYFYFYFYFCQFLPALFVDLLSLNLYLLTTYSSKHTVFLFCTNRMDVHL